MMTKRCVLFAKSLALGGLAATALGFGACGDDDEPIGDSTNDVSEAEVAETDVVEVEQPDTVAEVVEEVSQAVDGPLAPPDLPRHA